MTMINLGVIKSKTELPAGFISRTKASQYLDAHTLTPMTPIIEKAGLICYYAILRGKIIEYLNLGEVLAWGKERGYDFWPSSEISFEWRNYLKTLDSIYKDVERLKALAERMEFNKDEMTAVPSISRKHWPWGPKAMSLCDPRLRESTAPLTQREFTVPLTVYNSLQMRYKRLREKLVAVASGGQNLQSPLISSKLDKRFSVKARGKRFFVRVHRWVLEEEINLHRSFMDREEAYQWGREISDELDAIAFMQHTEGKLNNLEHGWLSSILFDPSKYLKASNGYLVEIAHKVVATEDPSTDGKYIPVETIHAHSIQFEDTLICGIYFLIDHTEIVYVGQSVDVFKRIREHRQQGYKKWDRFSMIPVRKEKLSEVEQWYIQHFRPRYNKSRRTPLPSEAKIHRIRIETESALLNSISHEKPSEINC